ncbi:hypothetical protein DSO57_1005841 [Entomophthora muscae]|uniref:Uncharacterized protein n=1 Tax=Entomophthora muscae TaxID=34485 RepID=A0ACC2UHN8_9FUNG|nr:hypothetical protein DSO57_1005841 [Entomophthora muscae]
MREIPGFYYDTERNRYFKIERGNSRANFVDSTQEADSSNSSSRTFHYDADTIRKIKKKKEEKDYKKLAGENRLKSLPNSCRRISRADSTKNKPFSSTSSIQKPSTSQPNKFHIY